MRVLLLSLILLAGLVKPVAALPSDARERTVSFDIYSGVLQEQRSFLVRLPESYFDKAEKTYPVFYVSDADWNFELVAATLDYHSFWGRMPEFIVVAAMNTSRNRDFLPGADAGFPNAGGGDAYLSHIEREWIPLIDSNFRANDVRVFFGHSFGGVLALNQLFSKPELFDAYIALGSSVWVADRIMFDRAKAAFDTDKDFDRFLYLSVGEGDGGATVPDGDAFAELMSKEAPSSLEWSYAVFPKENHFTNVTISLHDAIAKLFPFWGHDSELMEAARENGVKGVSNWFKDKKETLGWRFYPASMELGVASVRLAHGGAADEALAILDRLQSLYPDRPEILAVRAEALRAAGDLSGSVEAIEQAITLGTQIGYWPDRLQTYRNFRDRRMSEIGANSD
ncbi:alpha/beta hydrolase-fold protein [Hyphococcus sp.]|uniref:alpha/beta hydrolase-fold protein n=1 Tax=Hyphococcus sp. TaxID=2038636 RepID=UPI003CCB7ECF